MGASVSKRLLARKGSACVNIRWYVDYVLRAAFAAGRCARGVAWNEVPTPWAHNTSTWSYSYSTSLPANVLVDQLAVDQFEVLQEAVLQLAVLQEAVLQLAVLHEAVLQLAVLHEAALS